jgi:hypothetical protein
VVLAAAGFFALWCLLALAGATASVVINTASAILS